MSGRCTSRRTTSGSSSRVAARAARPPSASTPTSKPSASRSVRAMPRKRRSSSTIRILATFRWWQTRVRFAVRVATLFGRRGTEERPAYGTSPPLPEWNLGAEAGAAGGLALELQCAVERLDTVDEPAESRTLCRVGPAHAVVRDLDDDAAV